LTGKLAINSDIFVSLFDWFCKQTLDQ